MRSRRGSAQAAVMSVTVAMFFLIEAVTGCGPVVQFEGGAEAVPAILDVEAHAPEPPVPTLTSLSQSAGAPPSDPIAETDQPDAEPAAVQCKLAPSALRLVGRRDNDHMVPPGLVRAAGQG